PVKIMPAQAKTFGQAAQALAIANDDFAAACPSHGSNLFRCMLCVPAHEGNVFLDAFLAFNDRFPQTPFAFAGLVTEQVLFARLAAFQLPQGGHTKSFFAAFVSLHLRHGRLRAALPQNKRGLWPQPRGPKSLFLQSGKRNYSKTSLSEYPNRAHSLGREH